MIKGRFADCVAGLRAVVAANMVAPKRQMATLNPGEAGRFFDGHCNWQDIAQVEDAVRPSGAAQVASGLMGSARVQLSHDHVLLKKPWNHQADAVAHRWPLLFCPKAADRIVLVPA